MNKLFVFATILLASSFTFAATSQYTLTFRDDPATTVCIGWSGDPGTIYYGTTDEGTNYTNYPNTQAITRSGTAHNITRRFSRLTGLTPNTIYYFVIRDDAGQTSARFYFRTMSDDPNDPISFISGGDTRDGERIPVIGTYVENCPSGDCRERRRDGNKLVAKIRPDFIAFNGDLVLNTPVISDTEDELNNWLDDWQLTITSDGRIFPVTFIQGNHEDNSDVYNLFDVPQDEFYALDFNGGLMRMYMLNSELNPCSNANQLNWFTNDLQTHTGTSSDPIWKFATYHAPVYGMGEYGLEPDQMNCWVPLFEQYNVRLGMESHGHVTKWTYPSISNAAGDDFELAPTEFDGVVYIGEGQWGAPHRELEFTGANQKPYVRDQDHFDNYFFIRVNNQRTSIVSVRFDNINQVTASTDNSLGSDLPTNALIWTPSNGGEVILNLPIDTSNLNELDKIRSKVYPTITDETVNIQFDQVVDGATIELYNSLGKMCSSVDIEQVNNYEMDVKDACSGVNYIYIRLNDGTIESHKIVIAE